MTGDSLGESCAVLEALRAAIDARNRDALIGLFDESAVLIGSSGDGRDRQGGRRLTSGEMRAPIRVTVLAVETPDGWRLRQFHGSIPYGG